MPTGKIRKELSRIAALEALRRQQERTSTAIDVEVRRARRAGVSWREIGAAFKMSQQAASKRWGPYPRPRVVGKIGTAAPGGSTGAVDKTPRRPQDRAGV
jgi:hypothetical protein